MRKFFITALVISLLSVVAAYTYKAKTPALLSPECYISCFNAYNNDTWKSSLADFKDPSFQQMHENPLPFTLNNELGKMITFDAPDGVKAQGYYIAAKKKTNKWLLVIQEWWGLNDYIKKEAESYYTKLENVNVLALDMYDGKIATTRDSAAKYVQAATKERLESIIKGAIAYAGKKARIYTVGWCFGGMWSLQASLLAEKQAAGCVMFYGRPETDVEKLKNLHCEVIGFFGNKDRSPSPEMVDAFEKNMALADKKLYTYRYDAGHGFANPSNPSYNKEATADAFNKAIAFLKDRK